MDQNIFSQSDCMIFEVAMVKNGCGHSGLSTLTLAVSKEQMWFFLCWYKFRKANKLIQQFCSGSGLLNFILF